MKIRIENLGVLKQAEFSLGDMTIICGGNNTGKTYATYALFGFFSFWRDEYLVSVKNDGELDQLFAEGVVHIDLSKYILDSKKILSEACKKYERKLPLVFAAPKERFTDTKFKIILDEDIHLLEQYEQRIRTASTERLSLTKSEDSNELVVTLLEYERKNILIPREIVEQFIGNALKEVLFGNCFPSPYISSAERTGAAIFRKELNFKRNRLLEEMSRADKKINPMEILFKVYKDYPLPVKNNVNFMRDLETISKNSSALEDERPDLLSDFADIIGGKYTVTQNDELYFIPKGKRVKLSVDESSSSIRSLLDIGFYLRHVAKRGDLLMVDEPELNLHPENQRRITWLFARLVNFGIKVFLTTHSDYIIKELNTLIMLNQDKPHLKQIIQKEDYNPEALISSDKIKVYIAEKALIKLAGNKRRTPCQTLVPADIDSELGIEARSFDETIEKMNSIQEEIIWSDGGNCNDE